MTGFKNAAVSMGNDGKVCNALGIRRFRLMAEDTGGAISIWEDVVAPGTGAPLHIHTREEETFHVLSGQFRFVCGDESFACRPGTTMVLPRNVPHSFENIGTREGRLLVAVTPGGFERFFVEIEASRAVLPADIVAIGARHGLVFPAPAASGQVAV